MRIWKQSHSAEKSERGLPDCSTRISKYQKKTRMGPFGNLSKFSEKSRSAEPNKIERGTLCTMFPLAERGLSGFSSFSKKWTFQCEVCGQKGKALTKMTVHQFYQTLFNIIITLSVSTS